MPFIVLENTETGETREVNSSQVSYRAPWRAKGFIPDPEDRLLKKGEPDYTAVKVATWATKFGLPVPQFLDSVRWLIGKDCPFCQLGTKILRRIDKLGEERAKHIINRILAAKETNDTATLELIRREVTALIGEN